MNEAYCIGLVHSASFVIALTSVSVTTAKVGLHHLRRNHLAAFRNVFDLIYNLCTVLA